MIVQFLLSLIALITSCFCHLVIRRSGSLVFDCFCGRRVDDGEEVENEINQEEANKEKDE